jgi:hypothetical protein
MLDSYLPSGEEGLPPLPLVVPVWSTKSKKWLLNTTAILDVDVMFTTMAFVVRGHNATQARLNALEVCSGTITFSRMFDCSSVCIPGPVLFPCCECEKVDEDEGGGAAIRLVVDTGAVFGAAHFILRANRRLFAWHTSFTAGPDVTLELDGARIVTYGYPGHLTVKPLLVASDSFRDTVCLDWWGEDSAYHLEPCSAKFGTLVVSATRDVREMSSKEHPIRISAITVCKADGTRTDLVPRESVPGEYFAYAVFDLYDTAVCGHLCLRFDGAEDEDLDEDLEEDLDEDDTGEGMTILTSIVHAKDGSPFVINETDTWPVVLTMAMCCPSDITIV